MTRAAMPYSVLFRAAPTGPETPWQIVASSRTLADVRDELDGWREPRLHHGDLVRVVGPKTERGFVFNEATSAFVAWPRLKVLGREATWLDFWEEDTDGIFRPRDMMNVAEKVDLYRAVIATCACAVSVLPYAGPDRCLAASVIVEAMAAATGGEAPLLESLTNRLLDASQRATPRSAAVFAMRSAWSASRLMMYGHDLANGRTRMANAVWDATMSINVHAEGCPTPPENYPGEALSSLDRRRLVGVIREHMPLSTVICSRLGLRDPLPIEDRYGVAEAARRACAAPERRQNGGRSARWPRDARGVSVTDGARRALGRHLRAVVGAALAERAEAEARHRSAAARYGWCGGVSLGIGRRLEGEGLDVTGGFGLVLGGATVGGDHIWVVVRTAGGRVFVDASGDQFNARGDDGPFPRVLVGMEGELRAYELDHERDLDERCDEADDGADDDA